MSRQSLALTTNKISDSSPNEDSVLGRDNMLAVSDGAGGCGIFAKEWSQYLLENLPKQPFGEFAQFSAWTDSIWEKFYQERMDVMKQYDSFVANKFAKEGSFATLAVVWIEDKNMQWCAYGDSAIFVLNKVSGEMRFMSIEDVTIYDKNPQLINWKDAPKESGFHSGTHPLQDDDIVLVASDALSCYITMSYCAYTKNAQIENCQQSSGKLKSLMEKVLSFSVSLSAHKNFYDACILPLCLHEADGMEKAKFRAIIEHLYSYGVIWDDDYSLAISYKISEKY